MALHSAVRKQSNVDLMSSQAPAVWLLPLCVQLCRALCSLFGSMLMAKANSTTLLVGERTNIVGRTRTLVTRCPSSPLLCKVSSNLVSPKPQTSSSTSNQVFSLEQLLAALCRSLAMLNERVHPNAIRINRGLGHSGRRLDETFLFNSNRITFVGD